MSEKISKISVDGVVYDIASTGGGEVPGDIQEQLSALENKVTEEASAREEGDAKLSEKIESEASRVDGMVNQINENVASSIETLNNNLVQAIETINNGIAAEVTNREEGDAKLSEKIESEASRVDGMVNQINENVASSIETLNNNLVQAIETINNGIAAEVTNREEGDAKLQAAIDELAEKVNGEGADLTELEGKIEKNAADIATVNNNLVEAVNNINKNVADGFSTINGGLNNEIRPELEKAVKYEDTATEQNPGRKTIFLNNHDNICGKTTDGSAVNIAMVSKWNKVDLGSSSVEINLNGSAERPTYNDTEEIAYVSDVAGLSNTLEALNATVQILQSKVDVLTKTNTEVVSVDGSAGELKDSSKDYIVSGSINENAEIVGKSISLKSIKVSDNARLKLNAGDVEAKDLNISGSFPKANGNTVISVNNAEFIVFKDMVFDASEVYNGIEIGLASNSVLPKNILFDNCKFQGEFSNNAILVFGTQDNAIITLNNCYFEKISNTLRLSNKSNASGVVVNINNCTVDQWETRAPWQGFLICEDYTNKTEEEVNANNLFGDGKITVNFNNLVHAGVKINPADPASVCGTKNESQVVMVCQDAVAGPEGDYCLSYDAAKFPVVSFK